MTIPVVDLAEFTSGDAVLKQKFVNELGRAYEEVGFVAVKNHGVPDHLIADLYKYVQQFFSLPLEKKREYEIPDLAGQRGYTSFGKEHAKGSDAPDLKEFFQYGQKAEGEEYIPEEYPDNVQVNEISAFNPTFHESYRAFEESGKKLLQAIALYLGLDEFYFDNYIKEGNSILRPIHYPPITDEPKDAVRAAAHGDINLITLLMGAQGKGLQVQNHNGEWVDAIAQPDELMINVGDMLSRHTNNKLKSTIHQVVNPPRELWGSSRFSIPFFMHPVSDMSLNCLPECIDENNPKLYEDITAGEFLTERLIELGLIKK